MTHEVWQRVLAFYELSEWEVTLVAGDAMTIYADSVGESGGCYVFNMALAGSPLSLMPVAKIPVHLVDSIQSKYVGQAEPQAS